jgi:tetratricopeptide (TPR) repeat protein
MESQMTEDIRAKIQQLAREEQYDEVLELIDDLEKTSELPSNLLVLKGIAIGKAEKTNYRLSDAESAFRKALEIDEECIDALMELGWLYLMTRDDAQTSKSLFDKAFDICRRKLTESVIGIAKSLHETDGKAKVLQFLEDIRSKTLVDEDIRKLRDDVIGYV